METIKPMKAINKLKTVGISSGNLASAVLKKIEKRELVVKMKLIKPC
jgi:hypothetical protein